MITLPSHYPNYLVYLFSIFVIIISFKIGDLASKFGFDNSYYNLPLVCDV
jgi:hypothetical protein